MTTPVTEPAAAAPATPSSPIPASPRRAAHPAATHPRVAHPTAAVPRAPGLHAAHPRAARLRATRLRTPRPRTAPGAVLAVVAMSCVGSQVAVSAWLTDAPLFTSQALRYVIASALVLVVVRVAGLRVPRPRGAEWAWLAGVALSGLVLFNVGVVRGVAHAEPAVVGVAVAAVPVVLALAGPLAARRRPAGLVVAGAVLVTLGAVLVQGGGRTDAAGIGWALLVLACECGFTLLAVPVLARLGALGVSVHAIWMAAAGLGVLGLVTEGPGAILTLGPGELLAIGYIAVVVTVIGFLSWYTAVGRLGAGRAGLFTGVVPLVATAGGVLLGGPPPGPVVWAGVAVVVAGVVVGLRPRPGSAAAPSDT
ncbi:DMT family transporter [Myceligenerans crystallogenes]